MILDHLANRMGSNWPFAGEYAITNEIAAAAPVYAGLTWEALGDQGLQYDAAPVRPRGVYRQVVQRELPARDEGAFALVDGTVLYDAGRLFAMTEEMQNMAFGAAVGFNPADAAKLGLNAGDAVVLRSAQGELTLQAKLDDQVLPGTIWIPESLPGAPVGVLLDGSAATTVAVQTRQAQPA
jgi:predicted molibdopterin-dependent oxidoreductase YjgC